MILRRASVVLIGSCVVAGLAILLWRVLAPGGLTFAKCFIAAGFAGSAPWSGLSAANALIGVARPSRPIHDRAAAAAAGAPLPQTAIAVMVRNEDLAAVLPALERLVCALDAVGEGAAFTPWVLSDTTDAAAAAAEAHALAASALCGRLRYRRRLENTGFKAGNLMDFLDHHARDAEFVVVLDADSRMTETAVLRLVRTLQAEPQLAIVQHLTVGLPTAAAFPRLFQFGMRAGMRSWARAIAWWQGDEACYWGHNAALRIAPFRAHARLTSLPNGRTILSHDQIEAAQVAGAGWGVRLLPEEDGSFEANPPALPEFLRREVRWLAGNLQYGPLLWRPRLRPMGRWQLIQALLLSTSTAFQLLILAGAALASATDSVSAFSAGPALALTFAWTGALFAPKWLSFATLLASREERARYGGAGRVLCGIAAESVFAQVLDPVTMVAKTLAITRLVFGARPGWAQQNRGARGVGWREASRLLWPQTLLGVAVFAAFGAAGWHVALWAAPFAGGLLIAVPFCVVIAHPAVGAWLQRHGIAAMPEETGALRDTNRW